jgi:phage-related protein
MKTLAAPVLKPVIWIGSARANLSAFPEDVKDSIGFALYVARQGGKHRDAKSLRGFGGDTYRAVYTIRFAGRVYVLHAFQKKSKAGIKTPKAAIDLIRSILKRAVEVHAAWLEQQGRTKHHG